MATSIALHASLVTVTGALVHAFAMPVMPAWTVPSATVHISKSAHCAFPKPSVKMTAVVQVHVTFSTALASARSTEPGTIARLSCARHSHPCARHAHQKAAFDVKVGTT